ncbi:MULTISPECIES: ABC transporter ATP-binding protein [unclassified Nocardioides]|uniref:ABC transporter ATP-binding protein n=1 Tax=unclassified Nocardioides TaxID=2615069 RepID=UPI00114FDD05|nr:MULTISPECIES: ATP-binding cassette domain-containing protein [unclassified Nocardioides]TQK72287.1 branched-chain amino acid transport system ATP-binding protein [Nocardioides sp. SLBN-35]WGY03501.1 ATP-binding cassette domain-containing protein [Nocardioides sp. QY071]
MTRLDIDGLTVRYGGALAVDDLSLAVPAGQVTALVGPNGAGKSSAVLGACGTVRASGRVSLGGERIDGWSPGRRTRGGLALVPQGRQLFSRLTVRENLLIGADQLRLPARSVAAAEERFPILGERRGSLAGVLSGGEQQMLAVARALMGSPQVLLLDELVTGLAPLIVQQLAATVRELADAGLAVLVAAPDLVGLREVVDRGYVVVRGRVVADVDGGHRALQAAYERALGLVTQD